MPSAKEVDPPPLLAGEETPVESAATLQGTEGLDELSAPSPVAIHEEGPSLEQRQSIPHPDRPAQDERRHDLEGAREEEARPPAAAKLINASKIYIASYLVFFSILGTLARLGLQAITIYPGAPIALGEIWANVGGTLIMGFLAEDRSLFQRDLAPATQRSQKHNGGKEQLKKEHTAIKKTIPAYIGLSVGFCGSFTTFSSFMRDAFLALSADLNTAATSSAGQTSPPTPRPRNPGYSIEALLAVLILELAASLGALSLGAHLALLLETALPAPRHARAERNSTTTTTNTPPKSKSKSKPTPTRSLLDPLVAALAWPAWLGAVIMAVRPPRDAWRGQAVFALVFAPAGCLARYHLSLWLNARAPRFPLGTFAANVAGTLVLGVCFDLQRGGGSTSVVGCQVLQGVMDGFCGCLTTVSTWVLELKTLRRRHAYVYGAVSLAAGVGGLVVVMGSVRWTVGFGAVGCKT
ncbi:chromosome condensation protein [Diplodia corticola]|uniref:Chromosome condensation protein n=1 Tax=Diplodia corticola TaxID=236234 RepID=A0A1J9QPD9_9PEZI|nr:chromosome condensation protein [Diplodia corticola]OJD30782.1 chromosome condensation protein [Diplodia corticola]